jgi:hypothetical protein
MGRQLSRAVVALCATAALLGGAGQAATGASTSPSPRYGKTLALALVSGRVAVHLPGRSTFLPLEGISEVPVGTIVDARHGRVRLTSAKTRDSRSTQTAEFFDGKFRALQTPAGRPPLTVLKLETGLVCPIGKAAARSTDNGLWGSGEGNFRTVGKHGSATVRGTIWWAQDNCLGTMFRVKRGVVAIRDFGTGRSLLLHAGERYLARG